MNEFDVLLKYMEELARKAVSCGMTASKFLTPAEGAAVARHFAVRRDVSFSLEHGFPGESGERACAVLLNPDWGELDLSSVMTAMRVDYRKSDTLSHRDVLGALMGLGIERAVVGDIVCEEPPAYFVCLPGMTGYITQNLTKIGRVGVTVTAVSPDELPEREEKWTAQSETVASLRLDAVLSAGFRVSRNEASDLVRSGRVMIDHLICESISKELTEGMILSVRGLGRMKLIEVGGVSKKGRIRIELGTK